MRARGCSLVAPVRKRHAPCLRGARPLSRDGETPPVPLRPSEAAHVVLYGLLGRAVLVNARRTAFALARGFGLSWAISAGALAAHTLFPLVSTLYVAVCPVGLFLSLHGANLLALFCTSSCSRFCT